MKMIDESLPDSTIAIDRYRLAVPRALQSMGNWLVWRFEPAEKAADKPRKVPYYAGSGQRRRGIQGSPDDLAQLVSFEAALAAIESGHWSGLGLAHVPACGVNSWDFDNVFDDDGNLAPELEQLLRDSGTYCEISPSGRGVRMVALGNLPSIKRIHPGGYNIELFGESGFVTITGRTLCGEDVIPLPANVENTLRGWLQADLTEQPHTRTDQLSQVRAIDPTYQRLKEVGAIKRDWPDGRSSIVCPFESAHTSGSGRSDTVYFAPNTNGYANGHFHCLHAHCATRRDSDFRTELKVPEVDFSALMLARETPEATLPLLLDVGQLRASVGSLRWLVKHALPANSVGIVYGPSGSFKSFIVLDMALHVAHGAQWLNRKTKQGSVVYVAAEGGSGLLGRIDAWHKKHGLDAGAVPFRTCVVPLMLDHPRDLKRLSDAIAAADIGNPSLIVLDTMSQTMSGDENEARDTASYLRGIGAALRGRFESTVLPVHHTGHSTADRPRGSSVIKGNADFLYAVTRVDEQMNAVVECKKQKDGDNGGPIPFVLERLTIGRDDDGDELTSLVASYHDNATAIAKAAADEHEDPSRYERMLLDSVGQVGRIYAEARDEFYTKCGNKKPDTKLKAFKRAFKSLVETGRIKEAGNCVFRIDPDE